MIHWALLQLLGLGRSCSDTAVLQVRQKVVTAHLQVRNAIGLEKIESSLLREFSLVMELEVGLPFLPRMVQFPASFHHQDCLSILSVEGNGVGGVKYHPQTFQGITDF